MKIKLVSIVLGFLFASSLTSSAAISASHGIASLRISVVGSNVVLYWPSQTNQAFYVQYAPNLNPTSQWVTLVANLPAALATNRTSFTHSNIVQYPPPCGTNTGGGSLTPPGFSMLLNTGEKVFVTEQGEVLSPEDLLPYPWNPRFRAPEKMSKSGAPAQQSATANLQGEGGGENLTSDPCPLVTSMGFYRVFIPAPRAVGDVFSIAQNSGTNQLSILANDSDPEGNTFLLSNVTAAAHGAIQFSDDAKFFRYSPSSNYWGMDAFSYMLTNDVGGFAGTSVCVFVNKTGNNHPSAAPFSFNLLTNEMQISFPGLTNASDADSDTLSIALLFQPAHGTASTNASNVITYTRTSAIVAQDSFTYVISDGRGGFIQRKVTILPQDTDEDGMPDAWERQHGLSVTAADGNGDPDGDGIPNLAEYKLHTNPQTADNPLGLVHIPTGQQFSAYARVPLAMNHDIDPLPIVLQLNLLGTASSLEQAADGSWYFSWDTGYLTNGPGSIRLAFQHNPEAEPPATNRIFGAAKSVVVTNAVIFNSLNSEFTSLWFVDLTFPYANADWRIELWDELGGLVYYAGTTANGKVVGYWDLMYNQQQLSFADIRADVYVAPAGAALPNKPNARRWFMKQGTPVGDTFVVAWGWNKYNFNFIDWRTDLMLDGVINILANPILQNEYALLPAANSSFCCAFRYDDAIDQGILLNALKSSESGNFFWFGHGSEDSIEGNHKKSSLTASDVEAALDNRKHRSSPKKPKRNNHPYRLVILNGCDTYSAEWANAFGVDFAASGSTNGVSAYLQQGRQPQAFVGWTQGIQTPQYSYTHADYALGLAHLFTRWMGGYTLEESLALYATTMADKGFINHGSWKISGTQGLYRGAE